MLTFLEHFRIFLFIYLNSSLKVIFLLSKYYIFYITKSKQHQHIQKYTYKNTEIIIITKWLMFKRILKEFKIIA